MRLEWERAAQTGRPTGRGIACAGRRAFRGRVRGAARLRAGMGMGSADRACADCGGMPGVPAVKKMEVREVGGTGCLRKSAQGGGLCAEEDIEEKKDVNQTARRMETSAPRRLRSAFIPKRKSGWLKMRKRLKSIERLMKDDRKGLTSGAICCIFTVSGGQQRIAPPHGWRKSFVIGLGKPRMRKVENDFARKRLC